MKKNAIIYITFGLALILGAILLIFKGDIINNTATGILINILMLISGIWLLVKGADWFVDSSSNIAKMMKISALIIGLTIVSFGTSAPELAVSFTASIRAKLNGTTADIALGNVVGSNIANLLLVLGLSVAITPIIFKKSILGKEFLFLIMTQFILAFFAFDNFLANGRLTGGILNQITRGEALLLLTVIILFVYILVYGVKHPPVDELEDLKKNEMEAEASMGEIKPIWYIIIFLVLGLAGIILGGVLISNSAEYIAVKIATGAGANESDATVLVGLTVVAVGTSLPELVTSCVAAHRGENEIALGNVIGSNIFNTAFILGTAGVACNLGINDDVLIDILICIGVTILVFALACFYKVKDGEKEKGLLKRWQGILLVVLYVAYIVYIVIRTLA